MDLVTQGLLGATIGQAFYIDKIGKRAKWMGALIGMMPDIDVFFTSDPIKAMYLHRGYTHSIFIDTIWGILMGYILWLFFARRQQTMAAAKEEGYKGISSGTLRQGNNEPYCLFHWISFCVVVLVTHPLLDIFTSYGTQLFLPFTSIRVALDAVAVIDFFYSVPLIIVLIFGKIRPRRQGFWGKLVLLITTLYLFLGIYLNHAVIHIAQEQVMKNQAEQGQAISAENAYEITTYPTLFQPFLRHVLLIDREKNLLKSGFYTFLAQGQINFKDYENSKSTRVDNLYNTQEGEIFSWFSNGKNSVFEMDVDDDFLSEIKSNYEEVTGNDLLLTKESNAKLTLVRITDLRYVTLMHPLEGLWGIQALYQKTEKGETRLTTPFYFKKHRAITAESFASYMTVIWTMALYGD